MSGVDQAAAATKRAIDRTKSMHPIQTGPISRAQFSGSNYVVTVDLGYPEICTRFSSVFTSELAGHQAALESLVGTLVEVHFNQGQKPTIAYTIGV